MKTTYSFGISLAVALALGACSSDNNNTPASEVVLKSHSVTPALVKKLSGFDNLEVFSLIGSDDKLPQSPNFVFGGSADGTGWLKNTDGTFTALVNHEDNFAVSRITFDKTFKPVKGEYLLNSDGGQWRLCSATLATPQEHGFGPLFLTCGESGVESRTHAIDPYAPITSANVSKEQAGLGRWSAENAVPLPKTAYANKTVILIGDDDSGSGAGQLAMYIANTVGDLNNGELYVMRRKDQNVRERDMTANGTKHEVEFVKITDHKTLTGSQINTIVNEMKAIRFGRVEDIDYRKGGTGREVYFNATGQNNTGVNADNSRSKYGRLYRLVLDANDATKGTLEVVLDGDDRNGKAKEFQNIDNICVTQNYVYTQEDPNGYGDETHDSYIYQYNIATGELKKVIELDHRRTATDATKYNASTMSKFGDWEYGSMTDISDVIGVPNTFAICVQPHTWTGDAYKGVDGGKLRPNENQASQIIIIKGLAK